jgi:hypothetical protein
MPHTRCLLLLLTLGCAGDKATDPSTDTELTDETDETDAPIDTEAPPDTDTPPCAAPSFAGADPVVWYRLEDADNLTIDDAMDQHDGEAIGAVAAVAGKVGDGAEFSSADAAINAAPPFSPSAFSWAGWIRLDSNPSTFTTVAGLAGGPEAYTGWVFAITSGGVPTLFTEGGSAPTEIGTAAPTALTLGAWTHLAATLDDGHVELYVNGSSVASTDLAYTTMPAGSNSYWLGRDPNNDDRQLDGALDEVGLWDVALSAADVAALVVDGECGLSSR